MKQSIRTPELYVFSDYQVAVFIDHVHGPVELPRIIDIAWLAHPQVSVTLKPRTAQQ